MLVAYYNRDSGRRVFVGLRRDRARVIIVVILLLSKGHFLVPRMMHFREAIVIGWQVIERGSSPCLKRET